MVCARATLRHLGGLANTALAGSLAELGKRNNVRFGIDRRNGRVSLIAKCTIFSGDEIHVSYGAAFTRIIKKHVEDMAVEKGAPEAKKASFGWSDCARGCGARIRDTARAAATHILHCQG